jgi:hypothetical protein
VLVNFLVGAFAGFLTVFLPRMMMAISVETQPTMDTNVRLFHPDFLVLGSVFALVIGGIAAVLEMGKAGESRSPKDVFMAAFGIPALLSGVLTTTAATNKLEKVEQTNASVLSAVRGDNGIGKETRTGFEPLTGSAGPVRTGSADLFEIILPFVKSAYAETPGSKPDERFDPGIRIRRSSYVIILERASSEDDAIKAATRLQRTVPTAQPVKTDQGYIVVDSLKPRSESEAVLDALRLKSSLGRPPTLLQLPPN